MFRFSVRGAAFLAGAWVVVFVAGANDVWGQCQRGGPVSGASAASGQAMSARSAGGFSSPGGGAYSNPYAQALASMPSAQGYWLQQYAAAQAIDARRRERNERIRQIRLATREKKLAEEAAKKAALAAEAASPGPGIARK